MKQAPHSASTLARLYHNNLDKRPSVNVTDYSAPAFCGCGTEIIKRFKSGKAHKHCSINCAGTASKRARGVMPKHRIAACKCGHCGESFKPKRYDRTAYCSRECAFAGKAAAPSCALWAGYCAGCGNAFVSRRMRAYCNEACHKPTEYISTAPESKACKTCGCNFKPPIAKTRQEDFCGAECRKAAKSGQRRIAKGVRRARKRACHVEAVDPFKVFNRDGWRCQMCKIRTPKTKRGSYDDNAPELDHIIPISKGGEHSYRNTQCSCRKCNREKSDTPRGQLLMFG